MSDHTPNREIAIAFARRWLGPFLTVVPESYARQHRQSEQNISDLADLFMECAEKARAEEREICTKVPASEQLTNLIEFVRDHQGLVELTPGSEYGSRVGASRVRETAESLPAMIAALENAERGQAEARLAASNARQAQGLAEGALAASETAGIVDGWRTRALNAERARDEGMARFTMVEEIIRRWKRADHIRLHAGEMTAPEMRSVKAVVAAIEQEIEKVIGDDQ